MSTRFQIWKYQLTMHRTTDLALPKGAKALSFNMQNGAPMLWALVDTEESETETQSFLVIGTGFTLPLDALLDGFIGTAIDGAFVWHCWQCFRGDN